MNKKNIKTSDDFMPVYKEISDIIGPETTHAIFLCMRGQQLTLPKRLYITDYVLDQINKSGGNVDIHKVALEFDYTERYLKQLLINWNVVERSITTDTGIQVEGYKANIRVSDNKVLGIVTYRYKIVQNRDAFNFTDDLLGKGVHYETAGSLQEGRRVWLLAKLPSAYIVAGDRISPYLVFFSIFIHNHIARINV